MRGVLIAALPPLRVHAGPVVTLAFPENPKVTPEASGRIVHLSASRLQAAWQWKGLLTLAAFPWQGRRHKNYILMLQSKTYDEVATLGKVSYKLLFVRWTYLSIGFWLWMYVASFKKTKKQSELIDFWLTSLRKWLAHLDMELSYSFRNGSSHGDSSRCHWQWCLSKKQWCLKLRSWCHLVFEILCL